MIAREKGLEPLARVIMDQEDGKVQPEHFINSEKEVDSAEDALAGARDIIAEWISEDANIRARLRKLFPKVQPSAHWW